jgi:hypothetical protein
MLRKAILLLTLICCASIAFAQDKPQQQDPQRQEPKEKRFFTYQSCDYVVKLTAIITNKYGEQPLFQGTGLQFSAQDGKAYQSSMMYFVNQDTGSWSLVALYPDGTACMVANGRDFEPYSGDY